MNADLTEGLHTLRFKWGSTNFVIDSLRFSLKIPCLPTGIRDHFADQGFPIFPNPTSGMFYIDCGLQQQVKLELFNLLGDCIMHVNLHDNVNVLDINVMSKGVYALRLTGVNWSVQRKLIKK